MHTYFQNIGIAASQLWNTLWGGMPDETICSRAWRHHLKGKKVASWFVKVVNAIFFWQSNHCRGAYASEMNRIHTPEEIKGLG